MPKSEKGDNSVKYLQNFAKISHTMYTLNTVCEPSILFTVLLYYNKCRSWKREIIQSNIYRILPHVNNVIYTLNTICEPNIMILAQAVMLKSWVNQFKDELISCEREVYNIVAFAHVWHQFCLCLC